MILSDAIVTCLRELNLRYLFGVSGANIEHIHDSVHRLGHQKFTTIMTKSEFGAAFMADSRARVHNTLGVCCSTSGGGMMNLAVGIAESFAHAIPVLALVGQPPLAQEGRGSFQDSSGIGSTVNALEMWRAISKHACKITDAETFWLQFFKALTVPMQNRKGPSVILLPRDVMTIEVGNIPPYFIDEVIEKNQQKVQFDITPTTIQNMWQRIRSAQNPVMILGSGAVRSHAIEMAISFATNADIPVASTLSCPNAFPHHHPNYLGMIGVAGHPSAHEYIEQSADLIISVGSQLRAMTRATLEAAFAEKELWVINDSVDELDNQLSPSYCLQTPIADWLRAMCNAQALAPRAKSLPLQIPIECFKPQKIQYSFKAEALKKNLDSPQNKTPLTQSQALKVLNQYLPEEGHILFDAGNCAASAAHFLKMPLNVSNTIALGMGGMGYAVAGAIGAQLGEPTHKSTWVFCGDGAFMITGLEIHTAVELQLPILWIVFNNGMHGMCVTRQHLFFNGRIEGNTYDEIDIERIASGFGTPDKIWTRQVNYLEDLATSIQDYQLESPPKPGVLELKINNEEVPPFTPFLNQHVETEIAWAW